ISVSISNAQEVSRTDGQWKRYLLTWKGASADGRAGPLKSRCRVSSRSTLPGFLLFRQRVARGRTTSLRGYRLGSAWSIAAQACAVNAALQNVDFAADGATRPRLK